ncbi:MAG: hypothetical protein AAGF85_18625 [Bacteroidota bacterium]
MKTSVKLFSYVGIVLFFSVQYESMGQIPLNKNCSNTDGSQRAFNRVMFFLTLNDREAERIEVGATDETVEQIRPVDIEADCSNLTQIITNSIKYSRVDANLGDKRTKYYYKTGNLYYIFWDRKPEYDGIPFTAPKTLFIVVSKDFSEVWEYYF